MRSFGDWFADAGQWGEKKEAAPEAPQAPSAPFSAGLLICYVCNGSGVSAQNGIDACQYCCGMGTLHPVPQAATHQQPTAQAPLNPTISKSCAAYGCCDIAIQGSNYCWRGSHPGHPQPAQPAPPPPAPVASSNGAPWGSQQASPPAPATSPTYPATVNRDGQICPACNGWGFDMLGCDCEECTEISCQCGRKHGKPNYNDGSGWKHYCNGHGCQP